MLSLLLAAGVDLFEMAQGDDICERREGALLPPDQAREDPAEGECHRAVHLIRVRVRVRVGARVRVRARARVRVSQA